MKESDELSFGYTRNSVNGVEAPTFIYKAKLSRCSQNTYIFTADTQITLTMTIHFPYVSGRGCPRGMESASNEVLLKSEDHQFLLCPDEIVGICIVPKVYGVSLITAAKRLQNEPVCYVAFSANFKIAVEKRARQSQHDDQYGAIFLRSSKFRSEVGWVTCSHCCT